MQKKITIREELAEILLYTTPNQKVNFKVFLRNKKVWLTQKRIADLFGVDRTVVTKHLQNIFHSFELQEDSVCAKKAPTSAVQDKLYESDFDKELKKRGLNGTKA